MIPISRTLLTNEEMQSALSPIESGWLVQGPRVREFENKWCSFTGAKYSSAVTSCTAGLHLALLAAGIGPDDEVIVPAFTWVSSASVVEHVGAKVVFCDIDINTFNIDVKQIEEKLSPKTRAIIVVHLFGLPVDMDPVMQIAETNKISVIEDAACGFGAVYKNKHVGTIGDAGVFSFHPRKAITTGEGGMVTCHSQKFSQLVASLRDHGASTTDFDRHNSSAPYELADHAVAGLNYRMTDIQGALGAAQMSRAKEISEERRALAGRYCEGLDSVSWLKLPYPEGNCIHGYQSFACLFKSEDVATALSSINTEDVHKIRVCRNHIMQKLLEAGISTRPATHAVHSLTFFKNKYQLKATAMPHSYAAAACSISLPLFNGMKASEQDYVIDTILSMDV